MNNLDRRALALLLAAAVACGSFYGCGKEEGPVETVPPAPVVTEAPQPEEITYTFRQGVSALPESWNCHQVEGDPAGLLEYTMMPLYDVVLEGENSSRFRPEMAGGDPVDVTAEYAWAGNPWGIPEGVDEGYAFQVALNPEAKWEDGTPITPQDYIDSMELLLDPQRVNPNRVLFTTHEGELANAAAYVTGAMPTTASCVPLMGDPLEGEETHTTVEGMELYGSVTQVTTYFGCSLMEAVEGMARESGCTEEAVALLRQIVKTYAPLEDENGYFPMDEGYTEAIKEFLALDSPELESGLLFFSYGIPSGAQITDISQVGIQQVDDDTLVFIMANPISTWDFLNSVGSSLFLVNSGLYAEGGYATSPETYLSCGPYRITAVVEEEITLERNENWYGWTDGTHEGQFQTTHISITEMKDYDKGLVQFLSGDLSVFELDGHDMVLYGNSSRLAGQEISTTFRLSINGDPEALADLTDGSENAAILSLESFRDALSFSIDREDLGKLCIYGAVPALGLMNGCYYDDLEGSGLAYRDSRQGRGVLAALYDTQPTEEALNRLSGQSAVEATVLFRQAAEEALDSGLWDGEDIKLVISVQSLTNDKQNEVDSIARDVASAVMGTPLEGKITITAMENPLLGQEPASYAMAITAWSGYETTPIDLMGCYVDVPGGWCDETGFPYDRELTLAIGGVSHTKTVYDWYLSAQAGGEYHHADENTRLTILAGLEQVVLDQAQAIPLYSICSSMLVSRQIELGSTQGHILAGFGGIRAVSYNMSDSEWQDYLNSGDYNASGYKR